MGIDQELPEPLEESQTVVIPELTEESGLLE